jgi:hypothetical protein
MAAQEAAESGAAFSKEVMRLTAPLRHAGACGSAVTFLIYAYPALALRLANARLGTVPGYFRSRLPALRSGAGMVLRSFRLHSGERARRNMKAFTAKGAKVAKELEYF